MTETDRLIERAENPGLWLNPVAEVECPSGGGLTPNSTDVFGREDCEIGESVYSCSVENCGLLYGAGIFFPKELGVCARKAAMTPSARAKRVAIEFLDDPYAVDMSDPLWWPAADEGVYQLKVGRALEPRRDGVDWEPMRMSVPEFVTGVAYKLFDTGVISAADLELLPEVCYEIALEQARRAVKVAIA